MTFGPLLASGAVTLGALATAACLAVPQLYPPLYIAGLGLCSFAFESLRLALVRLTGKRAYAGLALICGLASVLLYWQGADASVLLAEGPEPVEIGALFLSQLQAFCAVAGVFAALRAAEDRLAAWAGLGLCLLSLFFVGNRGLETLPAKIGMATVTIVAALIVIGIFSRSLYRYISGQRK